MIPNKFRESKSISVALARMEAELTDHKEFVAFMQSECLLTNARLYQSKETSE